MNGFYITESSFSETEMTGNGVQKKIIDQLGAFRSVDITIDLINLYSHSGFILNILSRMWYKILIMNIPENFFSVDFYYFRYWRTSFAYIGLLKNIKKINNSAKIILEIPTYPYDKEIKKISSKINLFFDKILRSHLKLYVNRMVTFSNDNVIFGVSAIKIMNGINCANIAIRKIEEGQNGIHLIAVAQFALWHGYDRLIEGLNNYYKNGVHKEIYIHFVGSGQMLDSYKNLVQQYNLSKYVVFYGNLFGEQLSAIFNKADIAICSLGCHRIGISLGSFLKSREYLTRGFPIVSSTRIDVLPNNYKYCLYVPEDESSIDINQILNFYQKLREQQTLQEITQNIRFFSEENCDITKTMSNVFSYLKTTSL